MVFTFRESSISGTVIFSTGTISTTPPSIFLTKDSFEVTDKPLWVSNRRVEGEGNFSHYVGSDDGDVKIQVCLTGTSMESNKSIIRSNYDKVWYVDFSDIDSNLSGAYFVGNSPVFRPRIIRGVSFYLVDIVLRRYNN